MENLENEDMCIDGTSIFRSILDGSQQSFMLDNTCDFTFQLLSKHVGNKKICENIMKLFSLNSVIPDWGFNFDCNMPIFNNVIDKHKTSKVVALGWITFLNLLFNYSKSMKYADKSK